MRHRVVTIDDAPVGAISVLDRAEGFHLANLHLVPSCQGRGLGSALVRQAQDRARAAGRPLTTQVIKVSTALAFYERLGFHIDGDLGLRHRLLWEP
jgi:GNAT superfamily N-acetyltransferase